MKNKYTTLTVGTIPKSTSKIVERFEIDTPTTQIHYLPPSWLGTGTSIKSGGFYPASLAQPLIDEIYLLLEFPMTR